jgi:hypothetical protein
VIYTMEQGTDEWLAARVGKITASRIVDVMAFNQPSAAQAKEAGFKLVAEAVAAGIRGKESASRETYRWELAAERMTGLPRENSAAFAKRVIWGTEHEPIARELYGIRQGLSVDRVGFISHPTMDYAGGSPDALAGDGGIELKCPDTITHIQWIAAGVVPPDHELQCLFNMACAEKEWWDFASYDPRLPDDLRLFIAPRMYRDEKRIAEVEQAVSLYNETVKDLIYNLRHPRSLNDALVESLLEVA